MQEVNPEEVPEIEKNVSRLDILAGKAATEGAAYLLDYNKILNEIDDSIIFVDKSFKDLVNTMGRGENYAAGFGKVLEATAKDIILAGGKREDAIKIQTETLNIMGRASMLSQKQATDLFNASKVTGVASKDLTTAFLDSGRNLSNISKEMLVVRETAQSLGVNAKQVSSLVTSNLDKLNRFTFRGGVEGLARMAANAQSMRVGMESTFDLVDELMNPEKAIEMASEFQRMGIASADLTNPLKLMSMEAGELQEKIAEAMSKYVTIGEDGTKTISQQGVRVMKQLASQGVLTRGELEKLAIGTREMQDKMSKISFAGLNLDEDTQKLIANVAQLGEGGTYEIQTTDKNGEIISKSIEQFVQDLGGDQEKIRQALVSQEQKTGDASKDMGAIAQGQLDALTTMTKQNELLLASIGFTVSAGKMGPELLKASVELNKFINTPILKNIGSESDLGKGIDNTAVEIKNALEEFKSGKIDTNSLMKLLEEVGGAGGKLAGQFGETGMEIAKDYAEELGIGEDVVVNIIQGIKEGLPEAKEQGVELLYTILDGINVALEKMGIEVPDEFKKKKEEEKETGTGGVEKPKPPVLGSDKTTETPSPTPTETEKPKPPVLGSEITPGTGGDEGLLFLEDLQNLDLQQLTSQLIQPLEKLDITTSEVGTLNVQNLNIGTALDGIVNALGTIPQNQSQLTTLVNEVGKQQQTFQGGNLENAITSLNEGTSETTQEGTIQVETPEFNVEETLPEIEEGLPEVDTTLKKTRGGFAKTKPSFSEMEYGSKAPSQYESFKKVLEESYGGEIIGTGEEAFVLTDEKKDEAKKNAEFIGEYEPSDIIPPKEEEKFKPRIDEGMLPGEFNLRVGMGLGKIVNPADWKNEYPEAYDKINREASFGRLPGEEFELPELTKEQEEIMLEGYIPFKQTTKLEEKFYDMKATEGRRDIKKFEEEKLAAARLEGKDTMSEEDLKTLESMKKRVADYSEKSLMINSGEIESYTKMMKPIGLEPKKMELKMPKLASLPIPEKEEKKPLGERLKEGFGELKEKGKGLVGDIKEKIKGEKPEETPAAAVAPETQEEYIIRDKEGKELARSIDRETAEKKAGTSEGITVSKETRAITPSAPETPLVGVEQVASEVKEPKTLRERIEGGADKLSSGIEKFAGKLGEKFEGSKIKSKIDEARSKIKPREEESKIEPIKPKTVPTLSEEDKKFQEERQRKMEEESKIISLVQTDAYGKPVNLDGEEKSGYLKMLKENDAEADKFLTSKSGRPVNLDETEKIEPKLPTEETKSFSIDDIKLSDIMSEDDGTIVEPAEVFPTEDEVRQNKEKEETKARSFAYLEELRLREQTPTVPETPAKGIEKIAQLGQKFEGKIGRLKGKLFGKKEEEESSLAYYEPEISTEEPYISEGIEEASTEDYGTLAEETESEVTPPQAIEESVPSVPEPAVSPFGQLQDILRQGGGEQAAAQGETTQNINIHSTIEIVGNAEFAKLIDPRQFQQKIESIVTTSIGKPQIAQKFNSATSTEAASMGVKDTKRRRY